MKKRRARHFLGGTNFVVKQQKAGSVHIVKQYAYIMYS